MYFCFKAMVIVSNNSNVCNVLFKLNTHFLSRAFTVFNNSTTKHIPMGLISEYGFYISKFKFGNRFQGKINSKRIIIKLNLRKAVCIRKLINRRGYPYLGTVEGRRWSWISLPEKRATLAEQEIGGVVFFRVGLKEVEKRFVYYPFLRVMSEYRDCQYTRII